MNILCVLHSIYDFHYYQSILEALLRRGHTVRLIADETVSKSRSLEPIEALARERNTFTYGWGKRRSGLSRSILTTTRAMRSFRRFLVVKGQSKHYQDRWIQYHLPHLLRGIFKYIPGTRRLLATRAAEYVLAWIEDSIPPVRKIVKDIEDYRPDAVLVGPGNRPYPEDIEYIKAAKALHLPTIIPVFSWDNLTTKEIFHVSPDLLLVWNETQIKEAEQHHENLKTDQLRIVGAAQFDQWFQDLKPSTTREEFCKTYGLQAKDPILLYLGTTRKFSVDEVAIVRSIKHLLAEAQTPLKNLQIIIRPHPENAKKYETIDEEKEGIRVVPKGGSMPNTRNNLQLYFDTLYQAMGIVVGVHTSAMIESCIMDKPLIVLTHRVPKEVQSEVQHFQQFLHSGALELVGSDEELKSVLAKILNGRDDKKEKRAAFVRNFIRPYGLGMSAGERAADEIEQFVKAYDRDHAA